MEITIWNQFEFLFRLILSSVCGGIIGYEREKHLKTAGMRTHLIVSVSSALMMIISKYGFFDVLTEGIIRLDPSRVAAGIVSAIGFLGAGVIFVRKENVSGLTTSAGIWATVGVGMAIGTGMYIVGCAPTIIVILVHVVLNRNSRFIKSTLTQQITLEVNLIEDIEKILHKIFEDQKIEITGFKAKRIKDDLLEIRLLVRYPDAYEVKDVLFLLGKEPSIRSIEI